MLCVGYRFVSYDNGGVPGHTRQVVRAVVFTLNLWYVLGWRAPYFDEVQVLGCVRTGQQTCCTAGVAHCDQESPASPPLTPDPSLHGLRE